MTENLMDVFGVAQRFTTAAAKGYLEPIVNRQGYFTERSLAGFNHKHTTSLRQILDLPIREWSAKEVLDFANELLIGHLRKSNYRNN